MCNGREVATHSMSLGATGSRDDRARGCATTSDVTGDRVSTRDVAASERQCTVTGRQHADGSPMSVICEQVGGDGLVVLYPHGVNGSGVVLDVRQQRVLARWLLDRETTRPNH